MSRNDPIATETTFGAANYAPLPVVLVRGEGCRVWDNEGREYLDMMSAYSAVSHGHCHPRLVKVLSGQAGRLAMVSRAFYTDQLAPLLEKVCSLTGMDAALPMNTGAEAVETALKAARKWARDVKGVSGTPRIIACEGNFHGRTIAILGLSSEAGYREGFGPFPDGLDLVPYGDVDALEAAITPDTAAFIVEPIQGEGGIVVPPDGYLQRCAELCRQHNVLLIADEIQTGLGRTGTLLACEHDGVVPDGLVLGKALGGGLLPVSLFLTRRDVMDVFTAGSHGSTFGGNPLAAAVALEALALLDEENLIANSREQGHWFMQQLRAIDHPAITDIRGRGLFVGVELDPALVSARQVCEQMLQYGVLSKETHDTVVRFAPPLVIGRDDLRDTAEAFARALAETANTAVT